MPEEISAFEHWVRAVGLPLHFPRLDEVEFTDDTARDPAESDDRFYFGQPHEELIETVIQSLAQSELVNLMPDGHGVTTLARYVYHRSSAEAANRSLIPVRFSLEDALNGETIQKLSEKYSDQNSGWTPARTRYAELLSLAGRIPMEEKAREDVAHAAFGSITINLVEESLSAAIKEAIVQSLVSNPWERIITRSVYAELVGARASATSALEERRRQLQGLLSDKGDKEELFRSIAPELSQPWTTLMPELFKYNVRLSLQLDLSPSPIGRYYVDGEGERLTDAYTTALLNIASATKNIQQSSRDESARDAPAFMNCAFFMSPESFTTFQSQVTRLRGERTSFPPYSSLDVFTMLAVHFPRSTGGKRDRKDDLAAVLDSSLIEHKDDRALSTMIQGLSRRLHAMDMDDVRFQLTRSYEGIFGGGVGLEELKDWQTKVDERLAALEQETHAHGRDVEGSQP
jgi:hypothetical protein